MIIPNNQKKLNQNRSRNGQETSDSFIARGDEFHRALLLEAQQSINNNLNHIIVQNLTYRGRQGGTISEVVLDPSDIYEG